MVLLQRVEVALTMTHHTTPQALRLKKVAEEKTVELQARLDGVQHEYDSLHSGEWHPVAPWDEVGLDLVF